MDDRPLSSKKALEALDAVIAERGGLSEKDRRALEKAMPYIDLGWQIRAARAEKGLTQAQLAELAGLPQPRIAEMEAGGVNSTWRTITKVCRALGIDEIKIPPSAA
jgi:DNA-binding XRE family transcriptional regulator